MNATRLFLAAIALALVSACTSDVVGPEMPSQNEQPAAAFGQGTLGSGH